MADGSLHTAVDRLRRAVSLSNGGTADADLLSRFAVVRDAQAFEVLVERHGPMVRGVCRRVLGHEQDAEDAFQATFLALARSAGSIGRGSLAGWLYRAAYHVALKAKIKTARRKEVPAPPDFDADGDPALGAEARELRAVIDAEITRLPDRLRLPVVLCYFEGRSNSEAAAELGCPRGTVDSRLNTGRARLKARLIRRGVAPAAAAALLDRWAAGEAVGSTLSAAAIRSTSRAAIAFMSGSAGTSGILSPTVSALANEVLQMVFVSKLKWVAAMALVVGLIGTGGVSTYRAFADGDNAKVQPPGSPRAADADPDSRPTAQIQAAVPTSARQLRQTLRQPIVVDKTIENTPLKDVLEFLSEKYSVSIRLDLAAFARYGVSQPFRILEAQVHLPCGRNLTLADVLREVLAQTPDPDHQKPVTFLVKGSQIMIVPQFQTPHQRPNTVDEIQFFITPELAEEQLLGEPVSVDFQQTPLADVIRDLADQTGANIVLDVRQKDIGKTPITLSLQQVRLFKALQVIADMADLQPVAVHNVYYVTSPENAKKLEKREYPQPLVPPTAPPQVMGGIGIGGTVSPMAIPNNIGGGGIGISGTVPPTGGPPPGNAKP